MNKFGRNFLLLVQDNSPTRTFVSISLPFTLEFDIERKNLSSASTATIRVYNLNQETRNRLLKDVFDYAVDRTVILQAGYGHGEEFPIIFSGNIQECWSVREGNNFIMQIQALDGGFPYTNAVFNQQFPSGTPQQTIIEAMIKALSAYGVTPGSVGQYSGNTSRGSAFSGSTTDLLRELTGGGFFIDNMKANALNDNEAIPAPGIKLINVNSGGLLGTPKVEPYFINFDLLFEPSLIVGQIIQLESVTTPIFNGQYKVTRLHHRGTISSAVCGDAVTSVGAYRGPEKLTQVLQQS